jgi:hypothetical protein
MFASHEDTVASGVLATTSGDLGQPRPVVLAGLALTHGPPRPPSGSINSNLVAFCDGPTAVGDVDCGSGSVLTVLPAVADTRAMMGR